MNIEQVEQTKTEQERIRAAVLKRHQVFAVCEVMEQGLLNSPIAAYSNIEHAQVVARQNSNDQRSFAIVEIPFFMELGAFSE